jgi:hypothetical protein
MNAKKRNSYIFLVIFIIFMALPMLACDDGGDWGETAGNRLEEDYNTAWQDSGAPVLFGTVANETVGNITGVDYTD